MDRKVYLSSVSKNGSDLALLHLLLFLIFNVTMSSYILYENFVIFTPMLNDYLCNMITSTGVDVLTLAQCSLGLFYPVMSANTYADYI